MKVWMESRSSVPLKDVIRGRDNNLNLIRFVAATMVLVSHSFALFSGDAATEPWRNTLGMSMGGVAVDIFFCASGFLVAGSLVASQSARDFLAARALRIYPGLWVALLLIVLVMGPLVTTQSIGAFFASMETWKHLARNAVMVFGGAFQLPGVFEQNPWKGAVNGSLWTLPYELRAYLALLAIWGATVLLRRRLNFSFSKACLVAAIVVYAWAAWCVFAGEPNKFAALLAVFLFGTLCRLYAQKIVLNSWAALGVVAVLALALWVNVRVFWLAYVLALPYLLSCLAYLPAGHLRKFNGVGDYSYGIYIYAFPIQQLLMMGWVTSVGQLIGASFALTLILAIFSWHFVEKRALALRERSRNN